MVKYKQIKPPKLLENFVECYTIIESDSSVLQNKDFHIVPSGDLQLVVIYEDNYIDCFANRILPENPLLGPFKQYRIFRAVGNVGIFIIVFRPTGTVLLLNDSPLNLSGGYVSSGIISTFIRNLKDKLLEAKNNIERIKISNQELLKYFYRANLPKINVPIDAITHYIKYSKGVINIRKLAYRFNCSVSKLERNFKVISGLTPKSYSKIVRIRNVIKLGVRMDLMDVIFMLGYYDQAHFINEFRSIVGCSPLQFFNSDKNYRQDFSERIHAKRSYKNNE